MAADLKLVVHVLEREVRTGGWCKDCALPSLVEVDLTMALAGGIARRSFAFCTNHGEGAS